MSLIKLIGSESQDYVCFIHYCIRVFWMKATEITLASLREREFVGRTSGVNRPWNRAWKQAGTRQL